MNATHVDHENENALQAALVALSQVQPELDALDQSRAKLGAFCIRLVLHALVRNAVRAERGRG